MSEKSICWKSRKEPFKECDKSKCCYDAACRAIFEYEQYANSEYWLKIREKCEALTKELME